MSKIADSTITKLIRKQKSVNLHLKHGGRLTAVLVNHDTDNFYLSEGVAEKVAKRLVEKISCRNSFPDD